MLATDLKTGTVFKENGQPFLVLKYSHIKTARGAANVKVKAKNLLSGSVLEKSYLSSAKVQNADVLRKNAQYLYKNSGYIFMDPDTYAQVTVSKDVVGEQARFLKAGDVVQVLYFEDVPISIDLPISTVFEIAYTEPGFKGNTVSNVFKDATLDNDTVVKVPTFLEIGDKIKVDTRTGEYRSKVT
jgi:elongation factor P